MKSHEEDRILIIEDSPTQALYLSQILGSAGYGTLIASTGQEGMDSAMDLSPHLIILDVVLPDLDGFSICRRMRQQIKGYTPILMLTARNDVNDRVDGLEVGADDYMAKPFDERELLARVKALLRINRVHDDLHMTLEEERGSLKVLRKVALLDHLTGVFNRHYLSEVLEREFSKAQRYNTPLACVLVDIDHFRDFNTRYGHAVGDWVLRGVAEILKKNVRDSDVVARYGGDEFVLLEPMASTETASRSAERICEMVGKQKWESSQGGLEITISMGVAAFPEIEATSASELLDFADKALYQGKRGGRNRVCLYSCGTEN
jgi:diguanylate cyclase (GGDEF)-like protein